MPAGVVNLCGKICPFPIFIIIGQVDKMKPGDSLSFLVDDPLVLKSAPEELEDYAGITHSIEPVQEGWIISINMESDGGR
jgi:TusA-related sulfurtransferase